MCSTLVCRFFLITKLTIERLRLSQQLRAKLFIYFNLVILYAKLCIHCADHQRMFIAVVGSSDLNS